MKMKQMISIIVLILVGNSAYGDWGPPHEALVSQQGAPNSKIAKHENNVYVLSTDSNGDLALFKSADAGKTFDTGTVLGYDVKNRSTMEIETGPNGTLHVFWRDANQDCLFYRRSTDGGVTFSATAPLGESLGGWMEAPHCFIETPDIIYLVFRAAGTPKSEIWFMKSSNGGISFGSPVRVTNSLVQENEPKLIAVGNLIHIAFFEQDGSNVYYMRSENGGVSFGNLVQVNGREGQADGGLDMALSCNGAVFIAYRDISMDNGDLYVAKTTDGNSFSEIMAADETDREQEFPKIAVHNNIINIAWHDFRFNSGAVYLTRSMDCGSSYEKNFSVSESSDTQFVDSMAADQDGVYILTTDFEANPNATRLFVTGQLGDINANGATDLEDAVIGLKLLAAIDVSGLLSNNMLTNAELNGDAKIGPEEIAYILQISASIR